MTILSAINDITNVIGLNNKTAIFTSTDREDIELASMANRVAKAMAKHYDWQVLKTVATITGDGTTEDWALPTGYWRQPIETTLWVTSRPFYPLQHVLSTDLWLGIVTSSIQTSLGQWIIYGNQVHIRPALANADTAKYYYITNLIVDPASGSNKVAFTLDDDVFLLDEEVLGLGIIWRWKAAKGLPYAEEMRDYEIALAEAVARDKGSKILTVGVQRSRGGVDADLAWPGTLGP